ncbi:hypothetical protein IAU60_005910 [Kwoniella sp. DSM 27419]
MVHIKSSVLMAAAAFSAASALPTSNLNLDMDVNRAVPSSTSTSTLNAASFTDAAVVPSPTTSPRKAVVDVEVDLNRIEQRSVPVQPRRERKTQDEEDGSGLKRSVKDMVREVESHVSAKAKQDHQQAAKGPSREQGHGKARRLWKGRAGKRGPWRNDADSLINLNIGHAAADGRPVLADGGHILGSGPDNLINLDLRSPRHDDGNRDRLIYTGDGDAYYREAGRGHGHRLVEVVQEGYEHEHDHTHVHLHEDVARRHHGHSIVEVVGDDYYDRHEDRVHVIEGESDHAHGHGHDHVHEHLGKRRHDDADEVVILDGHRHHRPHVVDVVGPGSEHSHVHEHIHARSHDHDHDHDHDHGHGHDDVVVLAGDRHRHGSHGDVTVVEAGRYHGGDVTVVNTESGRHHGGDTTIVNNHKRSPASSPLSSPKSGFSSKLAGLGRAFLKRHRGGHDTTIVNNLNGHGSDSADTVIVNDADHGRHRHGGDRGDTTIVNNHKRGHHHSDRIVVVGDAQRYRDADFYYRHSWSHGLRNGRPIYFSNGDDFNRVRVIGGGVGIGAGLIAGSGVPYEAVAGYQPIDYQPVGYEGYGYAYGKRSHGTDRHNGRKGRHGHGGHGHKKATSAGEPDSESAAPADDAGEASPDKRHHHEDVTIVETSHGRHDHHGDVTVVNNGKRRHADPDDHRHGRERYCHDGVCHFDHHGSHDGGDVTVVKNVNKRSHDDRYGHHGGRHNHEECLHGRCNSLGGDVTIINNDKREARHGQDDSHSRGGRHGDVTIVNNKRQATAGASAVAPPVNAMGGAPGYIDVTSPVYNSTTAQRIASLVLSTSNGTDPNSEFVLNASNNIRTQVYLVPVTPTNSTVPAPGTSAAAAAAAPGTGQAGSASAASTPILVNLKVPIFVASSASVEPYCATFDPSPQSPAPLTVLPCTNSTSSHESQQFLYDPDTGVIHPDWQPSTDAQQLLQAVPDDVQAEGEDNAEPDVTAAMTTASATVAAAQAYATDGDFDTYSQSMTATGLSAASLARRAAAATTTLVPVTSSASPSVSGPGSTITSAAVSSVSASASAVASSTYASDPPPLPTGGPQTSTDSTPHAGNASNVTLIFTPANPSVVNAASFDQPPAPGTDSSDPSAQQATMSGLGRRSQWHEPDLDSSSSDADQPVVPASNDNSADINEGGNASSDSAPLAASSAPMANDSEGATTTAQPGPSDSAPAAGDDSHGGISASANVNVNTPLLQTFRGDSTQPLVQPNAAAQKPMAAPDFYTAPYEWRWTRADPSIDESALARGTVA